MEVYNEYKSDELYHHGVKGQRWGIRRFQNKDGSLTDAGERRRRSLGQVVHDHKVKKKRVEALKKARETKAANKEAAEKAAKEAEKRQKLIEKGKLSPKKMTDEELARSVARKKAEQQFKEYELANSTGKRFVSTMWNSAVVPGLAEGGRKLVGDLVLKKGSDLLGLNPKQVKSEYDQLKEAADISKFKKQIYDNEHDLRNMIKRDRATAEKEQMEANRKKAYEEAAQKVNSYDNSGRYHYKYKEASNSGKQTTVRLLEDKGNTTPNSENSKYGQAFIEDSRNGQLLIETTYQDIDIEHSGLINKFLAQHENKIYKYDEDFLAHYGVKGMKWGERRYQNKDGSLTPKGRERYLNKDSGMSAFAGMAPPRAPSWVKEDRYNEVTGIDNGDGTISWSMPLNSNLRQERYNQDYIDDPDTVFEKHMKKINETNGEEIGTTNNCTKVASAMILAKMGLDYDAGRCHGGDANAFDYWFEGQEKTVSDNLRDAIDQKFSKTENGSFGTVDLRNKNGGGHVFNWERNSKGEFALYEGQIKGGKKFAGNSPQECFDKYISERPWFSAESTVRINDMTHAKPNYDHMSEDSVVRITDDNRYLSLIRDTEDNNQLYTGL